MEQFLPGLTVKYVGGHIPELHIFPDEEGDDTVIEKIDLTKHFGKPKPTADDMRSLLLEKVRVDVLLQRFARSTSRARTHASACTHTHTHTHTHTLTLTLTFTLTHTTGIHKACSPGR